MARVDSDEDLSFETILSYVRRAPGNIQWVKDKEELVFMMSKKESAPLPDGLPCSVCFCAGDIGSKFFSDACKQIVEGGGVLQLLAGRRTVFIPKFSTVDGQDHIMRSPDALRP